MSITFSPLPIPFPKVDVDSTKPELEIFSTTFRKINPEPIIKAIQSKPEFSKRENLAIVLRNIGNDHYNENAYWRALSYYFESISLAPVNSVEYALSIAKRSKTLFALKKYKECLKDIDHILELNFPDNLLHKIYVRQTECFLQLKQNEKACASFAKACTQFKKYTEVYNEHYESLLKQIVALDKAGNSQDVVIPEVIYPKPQIKNGENGKFMGASTLVELKTAVSKGRYVVAKNDITQGDILFIEEPYVFVRIDSDDKVVYCSNCLKFCLTTVPCTNCALKFYCTAQCRKHGWEKAHKLECYGDRKNLFDCHMHLILNIICRASRSKFISVSENEVRYGNKTNNFPFVHKLATNKTKMRAAEMNLFTQYAMFLVIYLKNFTNYFKWIHEDPLFVKYTIDELCDFIGAIILKLCMQIYCNCTGIYNIDLLYDESHELDVQLIACGLYVSTSMINHSCEPNALVMFNDRTKIIRATKNIPKNTEITIDYARYDSPKGDDAKGYNYFKFVCNCALCSSLQGTNKKFPWLCKKCRGKAIHVNNKNYVQCTNNSCNYIFNMREYRHLELMIGPNLLSGTLTVNHQTIENVFNLMKKIYHKENYKFVGYYLSAFASYLEKPTILANSKKCLEIARGFVDFTNQFNEITDIKLNAFLRRNTAFVMHYSLVKLTKNPLEREVLRGLKASLVESKKILAYYVPPLVIDEYEKHIFKYIDEYIPTLMAIK